MQKFPRMKNFWPHLLIRATNFHFRNFKSKIYYISCMSLMKSLPEIEFAKGLPEWKMEISNFTENLNPEK